MSTCYVRYGIRVVVTLAVLLVALCEGLFGQTHAAPMLEIRLDAPRWVNGCLEFTLERVNISSQTIYLLEWEGLYFLLFTKLIHDAPTKKQEDTWLLIYGGSDILNLEAQPVAPGSEIADQLCLPETAAVVDRQNKTRRQVEVRGRMKIVAGYFPTEDDWKTNKAQHRQMLDLPHDKWPTLLRPHIASMELTLPCSTQSECPADCMTPPLIMEGEVRVIPDVYDHKKDWNDRGNILAEDLRRMYSACRK